MSKVVDLERVPKEYDSTISDPIKTLVQKKEIRIILRNMQKSI
ncbi:MAG: hypothetical protein ACLTCI_03685 [[Clostridium] nexile]